MASRLSIIRNHLGQTVEPPHPSVVTPKYLQDPLQFLKLEELLPADLNSSRKRLRALLDKEIAPMLPEYVERAEFPRAIIPFLKPFLGLSEAKYGCRKVSATEKSLILYELGRIDCSLATFYAMAMSLVIPTIEKLGSEEQKARYLPGLCSLDIIGCWGLTEPEVGSDASALTTTATPVEGGFVLNGAKRWIGNAPMSDLMVIWARNTATKQVEGFLVPTKTPGVNIKNIERKLGLRMVQNGHITMQEVRVASNARLEKATNFNNGANVVLEHSRLTLGWIPTGMMSGIYEATARYLQERKQFQAPIAAYQINQEKLVRILGHFQSSFLMCWRMTQLIEQNTANIAQASLVKAWTSLIGREAARLGREMMGGNGIIIDNYVMKALADMEVVYTYEGTYDINTLVAGRAITGIPAFKVPSFKGNR